MRILTAAFLLLALPLGAFAQRHYAILSLVGDEMMIVQREMATGSNIDTNNRWSVQMPDSSIDRTMAFAVEDAVKRSEPGAKTTLLVSRRQAVYDSVARELKHGDTSKAFEAVRPLIASAKGATHLILVTKYRRNAMLRIDNGYVGSGNLEGVGFYMDYGIQRGPVANLNEVESGMISPYAYFRVSLIDLASGKVISEDTAVGSKPKWNKVGTIGHAWAALTPQEKDQRLNDVIREETARVVPTVIAAR